MILPEFPKFYKLRLSDYDEYNELMSAYPAMSDLALPTLAIWWADENGEMPGISNLHGNVVIDYGNGKESDITGLALIGTNSLQESVDSIRCFLEAEGRRLHMVHLPEFVVQALREQGVNGVIIDNERDYDEYLIDAQSLCNLAGADYMRLRNKKSRFLREVGERSLRVEVLNLADPDIQDLLRASAVEWDMIYGSPNDESHEEYAALDRTLSVARELEIDCIGLYVDDELHGFSIHQRSYDGASLILNHMWAQREIPRTNDYLALIVAQRALELGAQTVNFEMDLGIPGLRIHKTELRPRDFYRKYRVEFSFSSCQNVQAYA